MCVALFFANVTIDRFAELRCNVDKEICLLKNRTYICLTKASMPIVMMLT